MEMPSTLQQKRDSGYAATLDIPSHLQHIDDAYKGDVSNAIEILTEEEEEYDTGNMKKFKPKSISTAIPTPPPTPVSPHTSPHFSKVSFGGYGNVAPSHREKQDIIDNSSASSASSSEAYPHGGVFTESPRSSLDSPHPRVVVNSTFGPRPTRDPNGPLRRPTIIIPQKIDSEVRRGEKEAYRFETNTLILIVGISSYIIGTFGLGVIALAFVLYQAYGYHHNRLDVIRENTIWEIQHDSVARERLRFNKGETVDWLNQLIQQIWKSLDPKLLIGVRDMIEDTMNRSAPAFVAAADVDCLELGQIAPRIDSIKIFGTEEYEAEDVLIGEASFSFRTSQSTATDGTSPPHISIWIKTGINMMIPIKVEFLGLAASVRFEIVTTGTAPFLHSGRFSFITTPVCETSINALVPINLTQFPILKQFIKDSLNAVLSQFTYPNASFVNLTEILTNDGVPHDTQSIGIVRIDVEEAVDLAKEDISGENDPYVTISLDPAPYSHAVATTRFIENAAHPKWRETHFLKIPQLDLLSEHIKLKLSVWDWDRFSADDHIGSVWHDLKEVVGNGEDEKAIHEGWTDIYLQPNDRKNRGRLKYNIRYYPKLKSQPDDEQTSGIFGILIHQGMGLQVTAPPYSQDVSDLSSIGNTAASPYPNPYAVVYVNDKKVFKTRSKLQNIAPYWNATTEQFVPDWKSATVRIVIKNQKDLEYDPVIGIVTIRLKDLFEGRPKMELTKWYPLRSGIGCGKVQLSFLFKPISIRLAPEEKGFNVGTLSVKSISAHDLDDKILNSRICLAYDIDQPRMEERRTAITKGTSASWDEETQFAVFQRNRTSITFRLIRRGLFGMMTPISKGEYPLRNLQNCVNREVDIPLFNMMPGHIHDTVTDDTSSQVCGRLRFTLHFYPGFAPIHEREIERSLTGVEASILKNNLARTIEQESVNAPEDEEAFHVGKERRLHKIHQKKYIRQLQFVSDEMMDKLHAVTRQKDWDDYREVVEREA